MIATNVYNNQGKVTGKMSLPEAFFGAKLNPQLLAQSVRVYLANQRKAKAKTKTRGEVKLTGAKWFRQKGTGRARHGARSAPIFVGGGVAHGPRGRQKRMTLPQKMRKQALAAALSRKLQEKDLLVVGGLEMFEGKTKELEGILKVFQGEKFLLVLSPKKSSVSQAARNLARVVVKTVNSLHPYDILNGGKILITPEAIETLKKNKK